MGGQKESLCLLRDCRGGKVFQSFFLAKWAEHAGATLHPDLGNNLSRKLVGIEIVAAGKLVKINDNRFRSGYNKNANPG